MNKNVFEQFLANAPPEIFVKMQNIDDSWTAFLPAIISGIVSIIASIIVAGVSIYSSKQAIKASEKTFKKNATIEYKSKIKLLSAKIYNLCRRETFNSPELKKNIIQYSDELRFLLSDVEAPKIIDLIEKLDNLTMSEVDSWKDQFETECRVILGGINIE